MREQSKEEFLKEKEEEGKRLKSAFRVGFLRGLSVVRVFIGKREIKMGKNEEQAFFFGQTCGVISFWIVLLVMIWIFLGG